MIVYRTLDEIAGRLGNAAVTIGNFDGVHLGHREIFRRVVDLSSRLGGASVVITFIPHPLKVLAPERDFRLITTYEEKERLIAESGVDCLVTIPFSRRLASIPAEDFVRDILVGRIGMKGIIVGYDYAFGKNREGDASVLRTLGAELGYSVDVLEQIGNDDEGFSSSMVRKMIAEGDVKGVVRLLGRNFSVGGKVVHGYHRGRLIGFPTANVRVEEELLPEPGVYAVKVEGEGSVWDGACNIGNNPTFHGSMVTVEVHLLDFDGDLYAKRLRVYFVDRVRDERAFSGIQALQEAIRHDVSTCREKLRNSGVIRYHG
ncbi:MAG: bifunctional riboflavin kinase/FAD synthetase [Geobacteraceae bacterium]|nr:bifunctional riboflavin kinase/FAD synthetase [Geobacteraceae bacterium]